MCALHFAVFFDFSDKTLKGLRVQPFVLGNFGFPFAQSGDLTEVIHGETALLVYQMGDAAAIVRAAFTTPDLLDKKQFIISNQRQPDFCLQFKQFASSNVFVKSELMECVISRWKNCW
jgi:hypothetical protein